MLYLAEVISHGSSGFIAAKETWERELSRGLEGDSEGLGSPELLPGGALGGSGGWLGHAS